MRPLRFHLECPHCQHSFWRTLKLKGSTTCPKCRRHFTRRAGVLPDSEPELCRYDAHETRIEHNARVMGPIDDAALRGRQIPTSLAEARFKRLCQDMGWLPHRPSWPDFIVEADDGPIAVEIKSRGDQLSPSQIQSFTLLERMGVRVYLWRDSAASRQRLVRWGQRPELDLILPAHVLDVLRALSSSTVHCTERVPAGLTSVTSLARRKALAG